MFDKIKPFTLNKKIRLIKKKFIQLLRYIGLDKGFPNFFTNGPFKEIKKVVDPFIKITHKLP